MASGGTLFLDEIGDMEAELQGKLLRVLQEKKIQRIGGQRELDIDVRIIAATNQDLEEAVNHGQFRLDLYYRLNVIKISLPPLRQRDGDIRLLALYFLNRENQRYGANIVLAGSALERLESYHWPGNIRQLENVIERLVILAESELITASEVDQVLSEEAGIQVAAPLVKGRARSGDSKTTPATGDRPYSRVDHAERQTIEDALQSARGNKSLAARRLGLTSRQFRYRLDKLGIQ
jgi:Nif-specific regulatory protein